MPEDDPEKPRPADVTDYIGKFRPWQWIVFGCVFYIYGSTGLPALNVTFLAPNITYRCMTGDETPLFGNSSDFWGLEGDQCKVFNSSESCDRWTYDTSFWHRTLTEKFNLVCGSSFYISLSNSIHHFGDIVASLYLSYLSDRFGRRPVLIFATIPGLIASVMAVFVPNIYVFLVAKFLYGLSALSLVSVGFVLLMEVVGPEYRGTLGLLVELSWAVFYILLPGVAWLMKDSFNIQIFTSCSYLVLILLWWLIPESPRWLLLQGRLDQAEKVIGNAAKFNKIKVVDLPGTIAKLSQTMKETHKSEQTRYTLLDLFKTPVLRKRTIVLYVYWFVNGFVYYGISLNSEIFGGSVFLNFFLFGVVEIPAYIIVAYAIQRVGRRIPLCSTMITAGLCCVAFAVVPEDLSRLRIALTVVGKFFIASSFAIAYPYTTEVFPTAVRTIALGSCSMTARVATMIAPFVKELELVSSLGIVMGLFGGMGIVSGALSWILPETKDKALPETILQGENFGRKKSEDRDLGPGKFTARLQGIDNPTGPTSQELTTIY